MSVGGVVLQFKADADKARKDIDKLTRTIEGVGRESTSAGKKMSKPAKVGVAAVAAGAVIGAAALLDFAKAAAEDWQQAEKLARTLKKIPGITDDMVEANAKWIDSMEIATGFADSDFRDAIARLALATGDLTQAQELAALAADVAAGRNKNLADIVPLLEKAVGGNTTALKRQMPLLDANRDGAVSAKEAFDGLAEAYGGAAKAAEDNDVLGRLGTIWSQLKESLGQFAIAPLQELADWFKDPKNIDGLQQWITKVGEASYAIGVQLVEDVKTKFIPFVENELLPMIQKVYDFFASPDGKAQIKSWGDALATLADTLGAVLSNLDKLFGLLDKLPGNKILQMLGLIPKLSDITSAGAEKKPTYPRTLTTEQANALGSRNRSDKPANQSTVNVQIINGRQEPSADSAALALRLARNLKGVA